MMSVRQEGPPVEKTITLPLEDWQALLKFADRMVQEIAEYDDDEEYIAVRSVLTKIARHLHEIGDADTPLLIPITSQVTPAP